MAPFADRNRYFQEIYDRKDLAIMGRNTNHLPSDPRVKAALRQAIDAEVYRHGGYNSPRFGHRFFRVGSTVPRAWADRFAAELARVVREHPPGLPAPDRPLY